VASAPQLHDPHRRHKSRALVTQGIMDGLPSVGASGSFEMFAAARAVVVTARTSVYATVRAAPIALADTGHVDHDGGHGA
jgi:hypothetical protein